MKSVVATLIIIGALYACTPEPEPAPNIVHCTANKLTYLISEEECERIGGYYVEK